MALNDSINIIHSTIEFIEKNIKEDITLDDISNNVNLSKFQLIRMFKHVTNQNLMVYVRSRKLSDSLDCLLNTELKIIDIASEYSFDYEQSYIRSFKNLFKMSPGRFRKDRPAVEITDRIELGKLESIAHNGLIFNPKIMIKSAFSIIGQKYRISDKEDEEFLMANKVGNDFYLNERQKIKNHKYQNIYIGYVEIPYPENSYNNYIPSVEVTAASEIPEGMRLVKIPANKYAVFTYIGLHHAMHTNINNLKEIHQFIFYKWIPRSNYNMAENYFFERIDTSISQENYCEIELYVPVKYKAE